MIAVITTIVTAIASLLGNGFKRYTELKKAEHGTRLSLELGKQKLIEKQIEFGHKLQIAQLRSTPRWFKVVTFVGWFLPYILIMVVPEKGIELFQNLAHAPLWYVQTSQVILFAVWGIAVSKDTIASIFGNLVDDWRLRRKVVAMDKVVHTSLDRKKLYKSLREDLGGSIDQKAVNQIEKALKKAGVV